MLSPQPPEAEGLIRFLGSLHAGKEKRRQVCFWRSKTSSDGSNVRISVAEAAGILGVATFIDATGRILRRAWSGVSLSPVATAQHVTSDPGKRLTRHL